MSKRFSKTEENEIDDLKKRIDGIEKFSSNLENELYDNVNDHEQRLQNLEMCECQKIEKIPRSFTGYPIYKKSKKK